MTIGLFLAVWGWVLTTLVLWRALAVSERELDETRRALAEWYEEAWHARRRAERAELGHDERTPLYLFPGAMHDRRN